MYTAKPLEYNIDALEPYINSEVIDIHYNKHYLNYLNKLNDLLRSVNFDKSYSKEELVNHIDEFDIGIRDDILYNLGGVLNHELYFSSMKINSSLSQELKDKIIEDFKSIDNFMNEFQNQARMLIGSGYTFLVINKDQHLEIVNFKNQETPYYYGLIPIIALDLWEHAYYLQYKNERNKYIDAFLKIINFNNVSNLYEKNI